MHLRRITPVSSISAARIIEQRVVALQPRENLDFDKPHDPIAHRNRVFDGCRTAVAICVLNRRCRAWRMLHACAT